MLRKSGPTKGSGEFADFNAYLFDWCNENKRRNFITRFAKLTKPPFELIIRLYKYKKSNHAKEEIKEIIQAGKELFNRFHPQLVIDFALDVYSSEDAEAKRVTANFLKGNTNNKLHQILINRLLDEQDPNAKEIGRMLATIGGRNLYVKLKRELSRARDGVKNNLIETLFKIDSLSTMELLEETLLTGSTANKKQGIAMLSRNKSVLSVKLLSQFLDDESPELRLEAVKAIGKIGLSEGIATLRKVVKDPHEPVREATLDVLSYFDSDATRSLLIEYLGDRNPAFPPKALKVLGISGDLSCIEPMLDYLKNPSYAFSESVIKSLMSMCEHGRISSVDLWLHIIKHEHPEVRRFANFIGSKFDEEGFSEKLYEALKKMNNRARSDLVKVLAEYRNEQLIQAVLKLLDDEDENLRQFAIRLMSHIGSKQFLPPLLKRLSKETEWWLKELIVEALGDLQDNRVVKSLIKTYLSDPDLRCASARALGKLRARDTLTIMLKNLKDEDEQVKLAVIEAVDNCRYYEPAVVSLLNGMILEQDRRVADKSKRLLEKIQRENPELRVKMQKSTSDAGGLLNRLLREMREVEGTELFVQSGEIPVVRRNQELEKTKHDRISPVVFESILKTILHPRQRAQLVRQHSLEIPFDVPDLPRFRLHISKHTDGLTLHFRLMPEDIPTLMTLGAPPAVIELAEVKQGLVLLVGQGNCGKEETIAALIDYYNENLETTILTIEKSITYVHQNKKSIVIQREAGLHTSSFSQALVYAQRQNFHVIFAGELDSAEAVNQALSAAEGGSLVFGAFSAATIPTALERIMALFPQENHNRSLMAIADQLQGAMNQQLIPARMGKGQLYAFEVMNCTSAITNQIRQGKFSQVLPLMESGVDMGMLLMDRSIKTMLDENKISGTQAYIHAHKKKDFEKYLDRRELDMLMEY